MNPKTKQEARRCVYGRWAGNLEGLPYVDTRCAAEVSDSVSGIFYQCMFKNGKGPDGLYCGIHAKKVKP
jgi:hypothetical protein